MTSRRPVSARIKALVDRLPKTVRVREVLVSPRLYRALQREAFAFEPRSDGDSVPVTIFGTRRKPTVVVEAR